MFGDFLRIQFMVWDLSRSVPMVFRSPGNPLINLFHFIFNSNCHFSKVSFFIELPIVLPIVLPIELPINRFGGHYVPGPRPGPGQGAGAGTPWARGRGRDPLGQGPGAPWAQDVGYAWRV